MQKQGMPCVSFLQNSHRFAILTRRFSRGRFEKPPKVNRGFKPQAFAQLLNGDLGMVNKTALGVADHNFVFVFNGGHADLTLKAFVKIRWADVADRRQIGNAQWRIVMAFDISHRINDPSVHGERFFRLHTGEERGEQVEKASRGMQRVKRRLSLLCHLRK